MQLRCKEGDLALIIREEPGCESNIGRIVKVRGPVGIDAENLLASWLIKPLIRQIWKVAVVRSVSSEIIYWKSRISHPDCWLLPLRPPEPEEQSGEPQSEPEEQPDKLTATPTKLVSPELEKIR